MTEVNVCIGSACHLHGAYNVLQAFQQQMEEHALHGKLDLKSSFCMKTCANEGVCVCVNDQKHKIMPEDARRFFETEIVPLT